MRCWWDIDLYSLGVNTIERPQWNNSERIDVLMRPKVVCLDVMPVACFPNAFQANHSLDEGLQIGIIDDSAEVALEVDYIHQIESN